MGRGNNSNNISSLNKNIAYWRIQFTWVAPILKRIAIFNMNMTSLASPFDLKLTSIITLPSTAEVPGWATRYSGILSECRAVYRHIIISIVTCIMQAQLDERASRIFKQIRQNWANTYPSWRSWNASMCRVCRLWNKVSVHMTLVASPVTTRENSFSEIFDKLQISHFVNWMRSFSLGLIL